MQKETPEYITWLQVTFALNDCREAGLVLDMLATKAVHPDGLEWLRTTCSRQLGTKHAVWAAEAFHQIVKIQKTAREEKAVKEKA